MDADSIKARLIDHLLAERAFRNQSVQRSAVIETVSDDCDPLSSDEIHTCLDQLVNNDESPVEAYKGGASGRVYLSGYRVAQRFRTDLCP